MTRDARCREYGVRHASVTHNRSHRSLGLGRDVDTPRPSVASHAIGIPIHGFIHPFPIRVGTFGSTSAFALFQRCPCSPAPIQTTTAKSFASIPEACISFYVVAYSLIMLLAELYPRKHFPLNNSTKIELSDNQTSLTSILTSIIVPVQPCTYHIFESMR